MPRYAEHQLDPERVLAIRIREERDKRGWTRDGLAARMRAAAGYAISGNSIWKVEEGQRRVTVNELQAYCLAFGIGAPALLTPMGEQSVKENALFSFAAGVVMLEDWAGEIEMEARGLPDSIPEDDRIELFRYAHGLWAAAGKVWQLMDDTFEHSAPHARAALKDLTEQRQREARKEILRVQSRELADEWSADLAERGLMDRWREDADQAEAQAAQQEGQK